MTLGSESDAVKRQETIAGVSLHAVSALTRKRRFRNEIRRRWVHVLRNECGAFSYKLGRNLDCLAADKIKIIENIEQALVKRALKK